MIQNINYGSKNGQAKNWLEDDHLIPLFLVEKHNSEVLQLHGEHMFLKLYIQWLKYCEKTKLNLDHPWVDYKSGSNTGRTYVVFILC